METKIKVIDVDVFTKIRQVTFDLLKGCVCTANFIMKGHMLINCPFPPFI